MENNKILLVEDDPNFGTVLKDYLLLNDYNVTLAKDGLEGLIMFKNDEYDLCILDVMMPRKDGFSLAEDIRATNKEVPIIFLTAKTLKEDVFRLNAEIGYFISKEYWGHYVFKSDTLIIQLLNTAGGHLPRRRLIEYKAIINDDSTFTYFSMRGFQGRTRILDPKIKYGFFPTNIKPDSTNIWFYDKEWYKENLHESRKK